MEKNVMERLIIDFAKAGNVLDDYYRGGRKDMKPAEYKLIALAMDNAAGELKLEYARLFDENYEEYTGDYDAETAEEAVRKAIEKMNKENK